MRAPSPRIFFVHAYLRDKLVRFGVTLCIDPSLKNEHATLSMEADEQLEQTEEQLPQVALNGAPETSLAEPAPSHPHWLRLAYSFEFLIAVVAILALWSEVGGQGHLDLMAWYIKLACVLVLAWCSVRFTASIVEQPKFWNHRSAGWFVGIIVLVVTMAGITYYYHLHEEPDQDSDEPSPTANVRSDRPASIFIGGGMV